MGAKANRAYLALVKETEFGITPTTPVMQKVNYTSEDVGYAIESEVSNSIRSDRMVSDVILTGGGNQGGFEFEMQYGQSGIDDNLLLAALWAAEWVGVSGTTGGTMSGEAITAVAATKTFTFPAGDRGSMVVGQKFKVSGSTSNNGIFTVVTADNVTGIYTVAETVVNETFAAGVAVSGGMIRNGLVRHSFTIEKGLTDVEEYFTYRGMVVNELSLNIEASAIVVGNVSFVGVNSGVVQAPIGGSYADAPTTSIMSSSFNIRNVMIDGAPIAACLLQSIEIGIGNNVEGKNAVGVFGYCNVDEGEFSVESSLSLYFADSTFYTKYLENTALSISLELYDSAGNGYLITIPRGKLSEDSVAISGKNTDIMDAATLVALVDPVTNCMFQIDRFTA